MMKPSNIKQPTIIPDHIKITKLPPRWAEGAVGAPGKLDPNNESGSIPASEWANETVINISETP